jgi:hypothetical protein
MLAVAKLIFLPTNTVVSMALMETLAFTISWESAKTSNEALIDAAAFLIAKLETAVDNSPDVADNAFCISIADADTDEVALMDISAFAIFMDEGLAERSNEGEDDVNAIFVPEVLTFE